MAMSAPATVVAIIITIIAVAVILSAAAPGFCGRIYVRIRFRPFFYNRFKQNGILPCRDQEEIRYLRRDKDGLPFRNIITCLAFGVTHLERSGA